MKTRLKPLSLAIGLAISTLMAGSAFADGYVIRVPVKNLKPTPLAFSYRLSSASYSFGNVQTGQIVTSNTVTLTNNGTGTLTGLALGLASDGYSLVTNNCGSTLGVSQSCSFQVQFAPTNAQSYPGSVSISADNMNGQTFSLTGTGTAPSSTTNVANLTFGSTPVGSTSTAQSVTLTNNGSGSISVGTPTTTGDFAATYNCGANLASSASCLINVTFTPTATGTRTGNLQVPTGAGTKTVGLSGTGTPVCTAGPTVVTALTSTPVSVPSGCGHVTIDSWGGGGGGSPGSSNAYGGGAGYVGATLAVGATDSFTVQVGQGGQYGTVCIFGASYCGAASTFASGNGGGGTFVSLNGTTILVAAGGGGAGGPGNNSQGATGGAAGGTTGTAGGNAYAYGGGPGTQTAGGGGGGATNGTYAGLPGSKSVGGNVYATTGTNSAGGGGYGGVGWGGNGAPGGGGGGYYGGGSGATGGYYNGGAGGGGGSSYASVTATITAGSSNGVPGNSGSANRNGAGQGGHASTGSNGIVVFTWSN